MRAFLIIFLLITYLPLSITEKSPFSAYQWKNRILVIYTTDTENNYFEQQQANFELHEKAYEARDLIIMQLTGQFLYQLPQNQLLPIAANQAKDFLSIKGNDSFQVSLIGKDGTIKHIANTPLNNQKLFAIIDAMPMRRQEVTSDY